MDNRSGSFQNAYHRNNFLDPSPVEFMSLQKTGKIRKKLSKSAILIAFLILAIVSVGILFKDSFGIGANSRPKNFSVQGSKILDPNGHEFIAKGVNMFAWERTEQFQSIANCWGFNAIRVPIFLTGQYNQPKPQDDNYQNIQAIAKTFTAAQKVVIFDAHDRIGSYYKGSDFESLKAYWQRMAQLFKHNPYVWFDLTNEPDTDRPDLKQWVRYHQELIQLIRDREEAKNIILVEGASWGQDAGSWDGENVNSASSAILSHGKDILRIRDRVYENIAFSIHIYEQWNAGGQARIRDFIDRVHAQNLALVIGEYGSENNNQNTLPATRAMFEAIPFRMRTATNKSVGHFVWVWKASDRNDLTKTPSGDGNLIDNCTQPKNLSTLGNLVWELIH